MLNVLKFFSKTKNAERASEGANATETVGMAELNDSDSVGHAFPGVERIIFNLQIRAQDNEIQPSLTNRSFGPKSRAYFQFRCKNVECVKGGFDLREEIDAAVEQNRSEFTGRRVCQGWRSSELLGQQKCFYELNFKIYISFHK